MGKVHLLDCTLRDGGYVNDWQFGADTIKGFGKKIAQTGIEIYEVGFIKGDKFDPDRAVFPDVESFKEMIQPKVPGLKYVGMYDMSAPVPLDRIPKCDGSSIDGIRVIFKKEKLDAAFETCKKIQELGYFISVNFVGTDQYTDEEFIRGIEKFNELKPYAVSIVDSFGVIKRKQFLRLVYIADNNLAPETALAYHAHNNLQQAFGNAEALVDMNLKRDIIIDACVFGMGRGAGNLNLELFAEYMNENYDTDYKIEPMLEIMDEYLSEIYREKFWGYSLPLYLSASTGCHPNYAIYLAEKDSLSAKDFGALLGSIPASDKASFSKDKANKYYKEFMDKKVDDSKTLEALRDAVAGKDIVVIAPGRSIKNCTDELAKRCNDANAISIAVNFFPEEYDIDYVFSNNMKRFSKIQNDVTVPCIITSNMTDASKQDYVIEFSKYSCDKPEIIDNSGLMLFRFLTDLGVKKVSVYGMDGYSDYYGKDYYDHKLEYVFSSDARKRNELISEELKEISKELTIDFATPTNYKI
ncbi:MAG: hypothetical protein E7302_14240 [Butyrivibrio sp.]|nr:hypothetical protein [Butyrivibrio sp.]